MKLGESWFVLPYAPAGKVDRAPHDAVAPTDAANYATHERPAVHADARLHRAPAAVWEGDHGSLALHFHGKPE